MKGSVKNLILNPICFFGSVPFINQRLLDASIKAYKKQFDRDLKHIKIILTNERPRMPFTVWMALVAETKQLILNSPQDFFCGELPSPPTLGVVIEQVFQGFIEDQRIRAVQTSQPFKLPF